MTDMDKNIEEAKAAMLPYKSWEQLPGESSAAFAAFCACRDLGPERSILDAVKRRKCTCYRFLRSVAVYGYARCVGGVRRTARFLLTRCIFAFCRVGAGHLLQLFHKNYIYHIFQSVIRLHAVYFAGLDISHAEKAYFH